MRNKLYIGFITFCLTLAFCNALVSDVHAQPRKKDNNRAKPNDKAKKLMQEGNKLFSRKDYRAAINKYAQAIVISPNYAEAHYWKGYAHYYLNEFNESAEELDTALSQGHPAIEIYRIRWVVNYQRQNYDAALSDLQKGLEEEPNDNDFITGLGEVLVKKGAYQEAIIPLQKSIKRNPNNGDLYYFLALGYSKTGDYVQQASAAADAVKKNTKFTGESYSLLGDSLAAVGKTTEAMEFYQRAMNVKPDLPEIFYVNVAQFYRAENRLSDAIDIARKGLKNYPTSTDLLVGLTWYYSLADRHAEAVGAGQQAVKNTPNEPMAHTNLCRALNDMKRYPQAIISCNNALKLNPEDGETYFYLARANENVNKPAVAADFYKKAVAGLTEYTRAFPKNPDGFYLLGNAYLSTGQTKQAIEAYKESVRLSPNFVKAHLNLGFAYITDGNIPAARQEYNTLQKLDTRIAEKLKNEIDNAK